MDTERRIDQLDARVGALEQERAADQRRLKRVRRRSILLLVIAGLTYLVVYLVYPSNLSSIIEGS